MLGDALGPRSLLAPLGISSIAVPVVEVDSAAVGEGEGPGDGASPPRGGTRGRPHPVHVHHQPFQVVDRQAIEIDDDEETVRVAPESEPRPPEPGETGWKDTVVAYPGEVTRVRMKFGSAGQFVWHCHIVEHEDNEMMRPYRIGPEQPGQPGQPG